MIIELILNHCRASSQRDYIWNAKDQSSSYMKSCEIATYLWDYIWLVSFTAEETALLLQVKGYAWKNGAEVHQNIFVFLLWSKKLLCWKCYSYLILRFLVSFTYPKRFDHTHSHTHTHTQAHILTISKQTMPLWEILENKNET